jgi:hypothetical protein
MGSYDLAGLRVFVSSTCFDLGQSRDQLRSMLIRMGYEPVMSEYSDILYDPQDHTHVSCVRDIANADMMVLMIGSRFGGTAVGQALPLIDFTALSDSSSSVEMLAEKEKLSITQLEVLKAVELEIPLFAFVDEKVYSDHKVYQNNKSNPVLEKIKFPSIDKPETAKYIFEFINLISHRVSNNAIVSYRNFARIEDHLIKQWSLLFQRLLRDRRDKSVDQRRADLVIEQIEGLRAAVLQSISAGAAREIAKSVLKYRRLADTINGLQGGPRRVNIDEFSGTFTELLDAYGVEEVTEGDLNRARCYLVLDDDSFYIARMPVRALLNLESDWEGFQELELGARHAVLEATESASSLVPSVRYIPESYRDYIERNERAYLTSSDASALREMAAASAPVAPPPAPVPPKAARKPSGKSTAKAVLVSRKAKPRVNE